jgi:hypothetical protein
MDSALDVHRLHFAFTITFHCRGARWVHAPGWRHGVGRAGRARQPLGGHEDRREVAGSHTRVWHEVLVGSARPYAGDVPPELCDPTARMAAVREPSLGGVFPALALAGLVGVHVLGARRQDRGAFLASSLYLAGILASVAFGVFPNVLPSNTTPELSLTIANAAAAEHRLVIGLWWFIPGMALVIAYSVVAYRHFAGKVE